MRMTSLIAVVYLVGCETDKSITVQNPTPKASIVSHSDGDSVLEGFTTRFVGSVTDSNHTATQLNTKWYLNGDVYCDNVSPNEFGETVCELTLDEGEQEITLAVWDLENARGEDSILITVTPTSAPVAEIVRPIEGDTYYADQLLTFEGFVSDAEDASELLTAYWESNLDGILSDVDSIPSGTGQILGYGNLSEGTHAIELHVEDTTGKMHTDAVILEVGAPNSAPTCGITSPISGAAGPQNELIVFEGVGEDVDIAEDQLIAGWSSDKDGPIGNTPVNSDGTIIFPFSDLSVNTHLIALTVEDEMGVSCTSSIVYTVGTPPTVVIDEPLDGTVVDEGAAITFAATVTDAQEQPNNIALDWKLNGTSFATDSATSSGEATFVDGSLSYGTYNLVVTATDGDGLTDSDQVSFTVNGVPTPPVVSIDPILPSTDDGLTVIIQTPSIDPEGGSVSYSYEWRLGGVSQGTHTTSTLSSAATSKGDEWTVVVTPTDGTTVGTAGMHTVTIQNTAPVVTSVLLSNPSNIYNDSQITCVDPNKGMIKKGKEKLSMFKRLNWIIASAEKLPLNENLFDFYTISFGLRNTKDLNKTLTEAYRVLKPGGRYFCLEFSKIQNSGLNFIYKKYSKLIPSIGKLVIGDKKPYEYLVESIENFLNQDELLDLMSNNGFKKCKYRNLSGGIVSIHSGWKI